jgi:hypothetical protein
MKKTSKMYIPIWDQVRRNGVSIDNQLTKAGIEFLIWDLNPVPQKRTNWVPAEKVWYYGHFYNSLEDFAKTDHGIFIFNAGDAYSDQHAEFVRLLEDQMTADEDIWVMSPRMVNDASEGMFSLIQMSKSHENMGLMSFINGIYVAMNREAALDILEYYRWLLANGYMDFSKMVTGHCLDKVCGAWAIYNNKKVYRKWDFFMRTEISTSYTLETAASDCKNIKDRFAEYLEYLGKDSAPLKVIYEAIEDKANYHFRTEYPIEKIYANLKNIEDLDY